MTTTRGRLNGSPPVDGEVTAAQLLTADQLAERWQVPTTHVYRLARDGRIPVVRVGRYYRFRLASIEAWEQAQEGATHA